MFFSLLFLKANQMFRFVQSRRSALDIQLSGSVWQTAICRTGSGKQVKIHTVPQTHVASKLFYNSVLEFTRSRIQICPTIKIVVEGIHESEAHKLNDEREYALIKNTPALAASIQDKVLTGKLYSEDVLREITREYGMDYSKIVEYNMNVASPELALQLQDSYLKPLLTVLAGDCMVSGDEVVTSEDLLHNPTTVISQRREKRCSSVITALLQDDCREVIIMWGHYHCPRILDHLKDDIEIIEVNETRRLAYGIPGSLM